ncbi:MAG: O-antigen ligase family protein [Pseudomonadota bacterium]
MIDRFLRRLFLFYLLVWPTAFGLTFVAIPVINNLHYFGLRYAMVAIPCVILMMGAFASPKSDHVLALDRWQWIAGSVFLVTFAWSTIFAVMPSYALLRFGMVGYLLLGGVSAMIWFKAAGPDYVVLNVYALIGSILLFAGFIVFFVPEFAIRNGIPIVTSFPPFFNIRRLTNYAGPIIVGALMVFSLLPHNSRSKQAILVLVLVGLWTLLFWAGSRAPVLALILALAGITILTPAGLRVRIWIATGMTACLGLVASLSLPRPDRHLGFVSRILETETYASAKAITSERTSQWAEAVSVILDRPLLGHGFGQYIFDPVAIRLGVASTHNFALEAVHDFGVIGGVALIVLVYGSVIQLALRARSGPRVAHIPLAMLVMMAVQSWFDAILYWYDTIFLFLLCIAMTVALLKNSRSRGPLRTIPSAPSEPEGPHPAGDGVGLGRSG